MAREVELLRIVVKLASASSGDIACVGGAGSRDPSVKLSLSMPRKDPRRIYTMPNF